MSGHVAGALFVVGPILTLSRVGEYPYNTVTDFGKANVSSPDIWCTAMGGQASCEQHKNSTIKAPVWATI